MMFLAISTTTIVLVLEILASAILFTLAVYWRKRFVELREDVKKIENKQLNRAQRRKSKRR